MTPPHRLRSHALDFYVSLITMATLVASVPPRVMQQSQRGGRSAGYKLGNTILATFNAHGLSARYKQECFAKDMMRRQIDVCCVQETKIDKDLDIMLGKYKLINFPPTCRAYGLAFIVAPTLIPLIHRCWAVSDRVAVLTIKPQLAKGARLSLHIVNCYGPTMSLVHKDEVERDHFYDALQSTISKLKTAHGLVFVCGDFNARLGHQAPGERFMGSYGRGVRNDNGRALASFAVTNDLVAANTCFQHHRNHRTTWEMKTKDNKHICNQIDFVFVPEQMRFTLKDARSYADTETDSDHRLVLCRLDLKGLYARWNKANLQGRPKRRAVSDLPQKQGEFLKRVMTNLPSQIPHTDPKQSLEVLNRALIDAAEATVGFLPSDVRTPSVDVADLSAQQKEIRNQMRTAPTPAVLHQLRKRRAGLLKEIHFRTRKAVFARIDSMARAVEDAKDGAQMFSAVQALRSVERSPLIVHDSDGKCLVQPVDKANAAAAFFASQLSDPSTLPLAPFIGSPRPLSSPIMPCEVMSAVKLLRVRRAAGPDGAEAELYKHGGPIVAEHLASIYNDIFITHTAPLLNEGIIVPLPKPGKPRGPCSSLRAVTLLNVTRKILSAIVLDRLRPKLEPSVGNYQSGFRATRSTTDVVWAKRWLVSLATIYKVRMHYLGLDLTRAFGSVNRARLLTLVEQHPKTVEDDHRLVRFLLAVTNLCVRCQGALSDPFGANVGAAEGDSLSPFLFILYLDAALADADHRLPLGLSPPQLDIRLQLPALSAYADDIDRYSSSAEYLELRLQSDMPVLRDWNMLINDAKTERVDIGYMSGRHAEDQCAICGRCCDQEAMQCDHCDSWVHYACTGLSPGAIDTLVANCNSCYMCQICVANAAGADEKWKSVKTLGSLLGDEKEVDRKIQLASVAFRQHLKLWPRRHLTSLRLRMRVYNAFVMPVLLYNVGALALSDKLGNTIDVFHRRQLRYVLGIRWPTTISNQRLYAITKSKPISLLAKERRWTFFGHICRLPADVPARRMMASFFRASSLLVKRVGRPKNCLAAVLNNDLLRSPVSHLYALHSLSDLRRLEEIAADRARWQKLVAQICD